MTTVTCPRCLAEVANTASFCPRCGLIDVVKAATDTAPIDLRGINGSYQVRDRLAVGSLASIYRCTISGSGSPGLFKIARDSRSNDFLTNEARVLRVLSTAAESPRYQPFFPRLFDSFPCGGSDGDPARQANVLCYHPEIHSADDLYSLAEVRAAYPGGLDAKDVAWIWRRLLTVLGHSHRQGVVHASVLPVHVLIEPKEHKLALIDWCFAKTRDGWNAAPDRTGGYRKWFDRDGVPRAVSPALDISMAARCMVYLLTGANGEPPAASTPAVDRHFARCIDTPDNGGVSAEQLSQQFDQLIEALWGPRQFRPLILPPRR